MLEALKNVMAEQSYWKSSQDSLYSLMIPLQWILKPEAKLSQWPLPGSGRGIKAHVQLQKPLHFNFSYLGSSQSIGSN